MAFKHGRLAEITVNTKALSLFMMSADISLKADTSDTTVFTNTWKTAIAGLVGGTLTLTGYYDPTVTTGPASVLNTLLGAAPFAVVFYPAGNNAGQGTSHSFNALITDYQESSNVNDRVNITATLLVTGVDTIAQL